MNACLIAAALLLGLVGLIHSVLGEHRLFMPHRARGRWVPYLKGQQLGILWVNWHLSSLLAWVLALALAERALSAAPWSAADRHLCLATAMALSCGALGVAGATSGRHLGWLGLGAAAGFTLLGIPG